MASLYHNFPIEEAEQQFYDALVSDTRCAISGVVAIRKGAPEWEEYLARKRQYLQGVTPQEQLEAMMKRFAAVEQHYEPTESLFAVHYEKHFENPRRIVKKRVIFDESHGIAAEVSPEKRRIDVFRDSTGPRSLRDAKIVEAQFLYDGTLRDALSEFEQKGYKLNSWDVNWHGEGLENGERTGRVGRIERAIPVEGVSIEDIMSRTPGLMSETFGF